MPSPGVVAVDIAAGQLAANGARHRVRGDAEQLPFRSGAFSAAGCAFGINHLLAPGEAVREMARVAPVVGVATWARPEPRYAPKQVVLEAPARRAGRSRSAMGEVVDTLADQVGTVAAVAALFEGAELESRVEQVTVVVPWPGVEAFLDYRLSMPSTAGSTSELSAVRPEAAGALAALPQDELDWHALVIVGVGRRVR